MMKKVLLVVLTLAIATSMSFAQTSGPSNVAGYVKITCNGDTPGVTFATAFGLPFKFWELDGSGIPQYGVESTSPSDIVGDQAAAGDAITSDKIVLQGGNQAFRDINNSNIWTGLLEDNAEMVPGKAFWYVNKTGAPRDLVLAGEVDNAGGYGAFTITDPPASPPNGNFATAYSWRDSRNVPVELLDLLAQGFTGGDVISSDKVVEQGGDGNQLNYLTAISDWDYGGAGTPFTTIIPGRAYWIVNKHPGNPYDYTYVGPATLPSTANGHEGIVTSTSKTRTVKTKAVERVTTSKRNNHKIDSRNAGSTSK